MTRTPTRPAVREGSRHEGRRHGGIVVAFVLCAGRLSHPAGTTTLQPGMSPQPPTQPASH